MFKKVGGRLSYANVTATLALVLSMSGGALAANHYLINSTKQINPRVLKRLRGETGRRGPAGPHGPPGQAAVGPAGAAGLAGATGGAGSARAFGAVSAAGLVAGARPPAPAWPRIEAPERISPCSSASARRSVSCFWMTRRSGRAP